MPTSRRGERGWVELDALIFLAVLILITVGIAGTVRTALSGSALAEGKIRDSIYEANQQTMSVLLSAER